MLSRVYSFTHLSDTLSLPSNTDCKRRSLRLSIQSVALDTQKIQIDREQVRMLVADVGYTEASNQTGIKRDTLYKWGQRNGWKTPIVHAQAVTVQSVQSMPADAQAALLVAHEQQTKLGLAKFTKQAIGAINKSVHPAKWTKEAHEVAKTAATTFKWDAKEQNQGNVVVNIALLGVDPATVQHPGATLDAET